MDTYSEYSDNIFYQIFKKIIFCSLTLKYNIFFISRIKNARHILNSSFFFCLSQYKKSRNYNPTKNLCFSISHTHTVTFIYVYIESCEWAILRREMQTVALGMSLNSLSVNFNHTPTSSSPCRFPSHLSRSGLSLSPLLTYPQNISSVKKKKKRHTENYYVLLGFSYPILVFVVIN